MATDIEIQDPVLRAFAELAQAELGKLPGGNPYDILYLEWASNSGQKVLRLYIDRLDGQPVGIEDCTAVNNTLALALEVNDPVPTAYTLEVSSPGVNRPLVRGQDFESHRGKIIELESLHPIQGRKRFKGVLQGLEGQEVALSVDREIYRIPLSEIKKARLDYFASTEKE